jgi:antitoxin component YwqK of YwqJK toxin-antitoxin module
MKFLIVIMSFLFFPVLTSAQEDILIIQLPDTFYVYHIRLSPNLSNNDRKVYIFDQYPQSIAKETALINGRRSGIEKTFYPSGKLYQTFVYADDKLWGEYRQYAEDGSQLVRGNFIDDKEYGLWIDNITGCTGRFKNGQKQGRWRCDEGEIPYRLYVYRKGEVKRTK